MEHLLCEKPSIVKKFSDQHAIVHLKMQGKKNIIFEDIFISSEKPVQTVFLCDFHSSIC